MARYEVVKPWSFSVSVGDVIETDALHPSLVAHVRKMPEVEPAAKLEVATPQRGRPKKDKQQEEESPE